VRLLEPAVNYVYTYNGNGQLDSRELIASDTLAATELLREYDSAGNMRFGYERQLDEYRDEVHGTGHRSLYGRDEKLRFYHQYGRQVPDVGEPDHANDLQQEFRYDALGRRVMVRNLHRPFCDPQERDCTHTIERYIWDGDQILWELRAPGDTYGSGKEYGRVAYVNGRGIDAPLGIARLSYVGGSFLLVPHMDWRGQWELGTDEDGERYPECGADPNCVRIGWPSTAVRSYMEKLGAEGEGDWLGSVLTDQRDPSGFLYRRNRYYDPMAGRFTQPDPIGLAGGINLYGFSGADPANFSDPFGLCTETDGWANCGDMIEYDQGLEIVYVAHGSGEWLYSQGKTGVWGGYEFTTPQKNTAARIGDCMDYVRYAVETALGDAWVGGSRDNQWTGAFLSAEGAEGYTEVEASMAQPGEVMS
jgi:RHS repeat-associated protein